MLLFARCSSFLGLFVVVVVVDVKSGFVHTPPQEYWKRGYEEVTTPNMYNMDLWQQSGHAAHYKDAMFRFPVEGQEFGTYYSVSCVPLRAFPFFIGRGGAGEEKGR